MIRIRGTRRAIALSTDGNGRYCYLDPYAGGQIAVAEACRNVSCAGAEPIALTDCLNFGNPEKPETYYQLEQCIEGMAAASRALGAPVVSGNVSLYNETMGQDIWPTPIIGALGLIDDVDRRAGIAFPGPDRLVVLLGADADLIRRPRRPRRQRVPPRRPRPHRGPPPHRPRPRSRRPARLPPPHPRGHRRVRPRLLRRRPRRRVGRVLHRRQLSASEPTSPYTADGTPPSSASASPASSSPFPPTASTTSAASAPPSASPGLVLGRTAGTTLTLPGASIPVTDLAHIWNTALERALTG